MRLGLQNRVTTDVSMKRETCISRYNVPFQRPNSIPSLFSYPLAGKILRKAGSLSGLLLNSYIQNIS
jgi:hypothetical protein